MEHLLTRFSANKIRITCWQNTLLIKLISDIFVESLADTEPALDLKFSSFAAVGVRPADDERGLLARLRGRLPQPRRLGGGAGDPLTWWNFDHGSDAMLRIGKTPGDGPRDGAERLLVPVRPGQVGGPAVPQKRRRLRRSLPFDGPKPLSQHRRRELRFLLSPGEQARISLGLLRSCTVWFYACTIFNALKSRPNLELQWCTNTTKKCLNGPCQG